LSGQVSTHRPRVARLLFARVPEFGKTKTRLAADLGDTAAYELYRWLLRVQNRVLRAKSPAVRKFSDYVFFAPAYSSLRARWNFQPDLVDLTAKFRPQSSGDLGQRLHQSVKKIFEQHDFVLIWGTDIPALPPGIFDQAIALYPQSTITLTHDGGYAFLSLARETYTPAVFENIRWSTASTGADQMSALVKVGLRPVVAGKVTDLDRAKDMIRVMRELEDFGRVEDLRDLRQTLSLLSEQ
jgi:uncharacterized protein